MAALAVGADVASVERATRRFGQSQRQRQQIVLVEELGLDLGEERELVHHTADASTHGLGRGPAAAVRAHAESPLRASRCCAAS